MVSSMGNCHTNRNLNRPLRRLKLGILAGSIAITINSAVLAAADWIPLETAHGGLLKLLTILLDDSFKKVGIVGLWYASGLPEVASQEFKLGFHLFVGIAMAAVYAVAIEPIFAASAWLKGGLYAVVIWLANAFIVLPWIGEGVAGSRSLGTMGIIYFAAAHTLFFVLMAVLYERLRRGISPRCDGHFRRANDDP